MRILSLSAISVFLLAASAHAAVITFGDQDCLGFGCYGATDPTSGATLQGLSPNTVTTATSSYAHSFPFSPSGDFPGTDQIYVGSIQTGFHDGYSTMGVRLNGPQTLVLNYSSLVSGGIGTLTLGIAADDFQFPVFGQPFTATVNGVVNTALTNLLNSLNQTGPVVQFVSIGLNPAIDTPTHTLTLAIDQGGDGGDGWAIDFLTVGVTTNAAAAPEPATAAPFLAGIAGLLLRRRLTRS
jgi:hypothetical protein